MFLTSLIPAPTSLLLSEVAALTPLVSTSETLRSGVVDMVEGSLSLEEEAERRGFMSLVLCVYVYVIQVVGLVFTTGGAGAYSIEGENEGMNEE